jgi:hypothetical protein
MKVNAKRLVSKKAAAIKYIFHHTDFLDLSVYTECLYSGTPLNVP